MTGGMGDIWQIKPVNGKYPPLADGIRQASECFHRRFGVWPTLVQCNPKQLAEAGIVSEHVKADKYVPPYAVHCWGSVPKKREG